MQPCAVCGGVSVNQAGYCLQCGTFRGVPSSQAGYPGHPPQQPPAPVYPGSGGPSYPGSAPPGYPGSGAPSYPGYPMAPQPPDRGRSYLVPLVALGATFVVLVAAIGVVIAVRGTGDGNRVTADPSVSPTPSASATSSALPTPREASPPLVDPCVVGTWQVDSYEEDIALEEPFGKTRFSGVGPGARVELREDGSGTTDYGDSTTFEGFVAGTVVTLTISGQVTYRFRALDGTVSFSDVDADGTVTLSAPGVGSESQTLVVEFDPASYQCDGDTMTQRTTLYTAEMSKR
ncbi:hypothetical protein O7621_05715 [Solwaraspora sp. WMMD937]|uniref:hypothetical protein n=1 Tax=Solwaraspora sp. WMMD937 TaxID=3016090 RepID=UPI00249A8DF7|nr:hypothetical protein [Solwaraspora sp. WMMD937]WFE22834.1 hypothetical protein O7621_05715 [Solwaraspora sp. WMMD937]